MTRFFLVESKFLQFTHSVVCYSHCGNHGNSLSPIFGKNFVKVTVCLNKLLYWRVDLTKYFFGEEREFLVFPYFFTLSLKIFCETYLSVLLVDLTEFFAETLIPKFFFVKTSHSIPLISRKKQNMGISPVVFFCKL